MPLYVPDNLPAIEQLASVGINIFPVSRMPKDTRPLKILLLNLMPIKQVTECDISRQLSKTELPIELVLVKIRGQRYKNTPQEYMETFYRNFDELASKQYEGMIVTGAPVERIAFEEVRYWKQLTEIFDWSRTEIGSAIYLCWGAQVGLYHHYGVPKYALPKKLFGVYEQRLTKQNLPIFRDMKSLFNMPHSRYTEVRESDINRVSDLEIFAKGDVSGVGIVKPKNRSEFFVMGHLEYSAATLNNEYRRDLGRGLHTAMPENYYFDNDPDKGINYSWQQPADAFYSNWLNYYVNKAQ